MILHVQLFKNLWTWISKYNGIHGKTFFENILSCYGHVIIIKTTDSETFYNSMYFNYWLKLIFYVWSGDLSSGPIWNLRSHSHSCAGSYCQPEHGQQDEFLDGVLKDLIVRAICIFHQATNKDFGSMNNFAKPYVHRSVFGK